MSTKHPTQLVAVAILDGPLAAEYPLAPEPAHGTGIVGARLVFEGIVRRDEDGRQLLALDYQTYDPMAEQVLTQLASSIVDKFGLERLSVQHSRGRVPVNRCSLRVVIESGHRGEGLNAMREFINRLKSDVPIWKSPVWAEPSDLQEFPRQDG